MKMTVLQVLARHIAVGATGRSHSATQVALVSGRKNKTQQDLADQQGFFRPKQLLFRLQSQEISFPPQCHQSQISSLKQQKDEPQHEDSQSSSFIQMTMVQSQKDLNEPEESPTVHCHKPEITNAPSKALSERTRSERTIERNKSAAKKIRLMVFELVCVYFCNLSVDFVVEHVLERNAVPFFYDFYSIAPSSDSNKRDLSNFTLKDSSTLFSPSNPYRSFYIGLLSFLTFFVVTWAKTIANMWQCTQMAVVNSKDMMAEKIPRMIGFRWVILNLINDLTWVIGEFFISEDSTMLQGAISLSGYAFVIFLFDMFVCLFPWMLACEDAIQAKFGLREEDTPFLMRYMMKVRDGWRRMKERRKRCVKGDALKGVQIVEEHLDLKSRPAKEPECQEDHLRKSQKQPEEQRQQKVKSSLLTNDPILRKSSLLTNDPILRKWMSDLVRARFFNDYDKKFYQNNYVESEYQKVKLELQKLELHKLKLDFKEKSASKGSSSEEDDEAESNENVNSIEKPNGRSNEKLNHSAQNNSTQNSNYTSDTNQLRDDDQLKEKHLTEQLQQLLRHEKTGKTLLNEYSWWALSRAMVVGLMGLTKDVMIFLFDWFRSSSGLQSNLDTSSLQSSSLQSEDIDSSSIGSDPRRLLSGIILASLFIIGRRFQYIAQQQEQKQLPLLGMFFINRPPCADPNIGLVSMFSVYPFSLFGLVNWLTVVIKQVVVMRNLNTVNLNTVNGGGLNGEGLDGEGLDGEGLNFLSGNGPNLDQFGLSYYLPAFLATATRSMITISLFAIVLHFFWIKYAMQFGLGKYADGGKTFVRPRETNPPPSELFATFLRADQIVYEWTFGGCRRKKKTNSQTVDTLSSEKSESDPKLKPKEAAHNKRKEDAFDFEAHLKKPESVLNFQVLAEQIKKDALEGVGTTSLLGLFLGRENKEYESHTDSHSFQRNRAKFYKRRTRKLSLGREKVQYEGVSPVSEV